MKSVKHDHIRGIFHSGGDHGAAYKNRKGILYFSENGEILPKCAAFCILCKMKCKTEKGPHPEKDAGSKTTPVNRIDCMIVSFLK